MRSVPIILNKTVRHLRYTFRAAEDIDQLVPGGFLSVFGRDMDVGITHLLVWAGLQHEGVSYEEIGTYLISENAVYDETVLEQIWKKITYALINDRWLAGEDKEPSSGERPTPLPEILKELERAALEYNIYPEDFYGFTPREFHIIQNNFGLRDNIRTGILCSIQANIHCKKPSGRPFEPRDFIRVGPAEPPQTVEQQVATLTDIFGG